MKQEKRGANPKDDPEEEERLQQKAEAIELQKGILAEKVRVDDEMSKGSLRDRFRKRKGVSESVQVSLEDEWDEYESPLNEDDKYHSSGDEETVVDSSGVVKRSVGTPQMAAVVSKVVQIKKSLDESKEYLRHLGKNYTKICEYLQNYTKVLTPFSFNIMDFTEQTTANIYKNEDGSEIFSSGKDQVTLNIAKNSHNSDYVNFLNMAIDCSFYIHEIDLITTNHGISNPTPSITNWQRIKKIIIYTIGFVGATAAVIFAGPAGAAAIGIISGALKVLGVLADQIGGVSDGDATEEREAFIGQTSHLGHSVSDMLASVSIFLVAIASAQGGGGLKKYIKASRKPTKKSSRKRVRKTAKRVVRGTVRKMRNKSTRRRPVKKSRRPVKKSKRRPIKKSSRKNRTRRK